MSRAVNDVLPLTDLWTDPGDCVVVDEMVASTKGGEIVPDLRT